MSLQKDENGKVLHEEGSMPSFNIQVETKSYNCYYPKRKTIIPDFLL